MIYKHKDTSMSLPPPALLDALAGDFDRIAAGRHHDPHGVLGPHRHGAKLAVIAYIPRASTVRFAGRTAQRIAPDSDFFAWWGEPADLPPHYEVVWTDGAGHQYAQVDPYSFGPQISAEDLTAFGAGRHRSLWRCLGAHECQIDGVRGTRFAVWAPDAERVSVVGDFCLWDGRRYPMRNRGASGVWEIFLPGVGAGELYKFEIRSRNGPVQPLKSDPLARAAERRPSTASRVAGPSEYVWGDAAWLDARRQRDWLHAPLSIYELHLGSWRHGAGGTVSYRDIAAPLVDYLRQTGFTHVELLPITEHPLDESWGYQTTGYFAPTSRYGTPDDLRHLIDHCHRAGIGVLLDWAPGHFPRDAHGLANFDGTALYEHPDPRRAEQRDWGTLIFNYERHEVRSFLISSACYWLEEFHFDGLRIDAVAAMLYLDFSRRKDDFVPNKYGGNQNLEAIDFLRELNTVLHARYPGCVVIAEESTDWPLVSRPVELGGLGFSMKWNMGW
ncbi:MAG: 1,4-alpha-glucan branching enzyme, partial [Steroidobacteraceae bacterium]|nr:1,4-alpha-glucan branching enzyme [Steroidobacteraceae bacterium]